MTEPPRLAVFDLDGTLLDSRRNIIRAVGDAAQAVGLTAPPPDTVQRVVGLSLDEALATLFPEAAAETLSELDRAYRDCFVRYRASSDYEEPLFEGTHEAIGELEQAGFVLAIATGKARRGVNYFLDRHGLVGRFVSIQTPETAPGKPHPGMVLQAMAETGAEPESTVMIGDTTYDILMARAARAHAVGVSWGNHSSEELTAAGAHRLVDRLSDLLQAVEDVIVRPKVGSEKEHSP